MNSWNYWPAPSPCPKVEYATPVTLAIEQVTAKVSFVDLRIYTALKPDKPSELTYKSIIHHGKAAHKLFVSRPCVHRSVISTTKSL